MLQPSGGLSESNASPGAQSALGAQGAGRGLWTWVPPPFPQLLLLSDPPPPRYQPREEGASLLPALHHGQYLRRLLAGGLQVSAVAPLRRKPGHQLGDVLGRGAGEPHRAGAAGAPLAGGRGTQRRTRELYLPVPRVGDRAGVHRPAWDLPHQPGGAGFLRSEPDLGGPGA